MWLLNLWDSSLISRSHVQSRYHAFVASIIIIIITISNEYSIDTEVGQLRTGNVAKLVKHLFDLAP